MFAKFSTRAITVYYDLEEGRYYTESEMKNKTKQLSDLEICARFIPIVRSCGGR